MLGLSKNGEIFVSTRCDTVMCTGYTLDIEFAIGSTFCGLVKKIIKKTCIVRVFCWIVIIFLEN